MNVQLSRIEKTLNALARAPRKREGDLLARLHAEADVLRAAFAEVRAEALEEAVRAAEEVPEGGDPWVRSMRIVDAIRALNARQP